MSMFMPRSMSSLGRRLPLVWEEFLDAAVRMRGQPLEHVPEVGMWVVPVELGRLQQAHHDRGALSGELAAAEQPCLPSHGPGSDLVLQMVVVQRHVAVEQVARERPPVL